ncbi:MAG: hypothetical protein JWN79_1149 [Gemmatimonadetes bacterium]|jgi:hypothetical protein|nr:hypothetical protein [Gemmatimonadota bacterium]
MPRSPLLMRRALQPALPVLLAVALATAAPHPSGAQLYQGDTVRLTIGSLEIARGAFVRADSAAVYLRARGEPSASRTPYTDYTRADLLLGHRHAAGRAVARGAVVGVGIGAALGLASTVLHPGHGGLASGVQSLVAGAAAGAALGSGVGGAASGVTEEVWRTVDVRQIASAPVVATVGGVTPPGNDTVPRVATPRPARTPGRVAVGDTVRLFITPSEEVRGILVRIDSAEFLVNPMNASDTVRYARESISRAEVRRGDRRRGVNALATGTAVGAAIGAGFVTLGIAANKKGDEGLGVIIGLFFGAVSVATGTVVGGVVALTYTDLWIPFDPATMNYRALAAAPRA